MYDRILFPTDGSDAANAVRDYVLDLAAAEDATLEVLYVANSNENSVTRVGGEVVDALEQHGEEVVADVEDRAADRGVDVRSTVEQGDPSGTILAYADHRDVDLIVMATHGRRGLDRMLLGSVTERVARKAARPVLTVRPDDDVSRRYPPESVLVPTDGSAVSKRAVDEGAALAAEQDATLHLLTVIDPSVFGGDDYAVMPTDVFEERAESILDRAVARAEDAGATDVVRAREFGNPRRTIGRYAGEEAVDLVAMGTHGRSGVDRFLMGSVTEGTVRTAPVPVLTVRGTDD
ncbi:Nucleotide-binding universal stress protein, UspA family [Halomicrobium zhouii]|uniref:Nucleotide-binding universal stress protein, UspA family n=1 Tax=Halomicrobium zhouii TaxID=767519 RepID=A0A1I6KN59_9EURY|nr:universal stress protein [Halomicrobium zhouii]SFR92682.1 Nucleotide-binding universal stress protein, UspA family [Halomicrobium zhouii]